MAGKFADGKSSKPAIRTINKDADPAAKLIGNERLRQTRQ